MSGGLPGSVFGSEVGETFCCVVDRLLGFGGESQRESGGWLVRGQVVGLAGPKVDDVAVVIGAAVGA